MLRRRATWTQLIGLINVIQLLLQGQDSASISHMMSSQLRSISSPFVSIEPVPPTALAASAAAATDTPQGPVEELHFVAEASAVAEWLAGAGVALVLGQLRKQGTDGLVACQEDAQREMKCRQAMVSVQSFESNGVINPQVGMNDMLAAMCGQHTLC
jgi:hypothetical protein